MGSDPKSKEEHRTKKMKKNKRKGGSPSSSSQDADERRERKRLRRTTLDNKGSKTRNNKKSSPKSHRSSKHHSSSSEMKSEEKHKSKHHKQDCHLKLAFQELSSDDYFSKNNEFATWLKEDKDLFFSDLSSESARDLFSQFVEVWNKQKLEYRYYEGITTAPRTSHKWRIK
ncbi:hypothetical protein LguiA_035784 [Lonicera macranthoides]